MCEETPAVVYCVGYVLPVACCMAGACMSCYGCYRYYRANEARRRRMERMQRDGAGFPEVFPRIKRDTLKRKMLKAFTRSVSAKNEKDINMLSINEQVLKDMEDACPICIDSYDDDPNAIFVGLVKKCGHYFHFECLWNWLELNQTCPICRVTCDLAESDLQGLSLKQVLEVTRSHDNHQANPNNMASTSTSKLDVLFNDAPLQYGVHVSRHVRHESSSASSQTSNDVMRSQVVVAAETAVITSQPRSLTSSSSPTGSVAGAEPFRRSRLIEQMKRRFESGDASDVNCDINVRDIDSEDDNRRISINSGTVS